MQFKKSLLVLTRQPNISYSGLQACAGSRRSAQAMVIPLSSAATLSRCMPEAPNPMIFNDRPPRAGSQTALAKLAVEWLQRRFAVLLRASTRRLNTVYIVAGLIITCSVLFPSLSQAVELVVEHELTVRLNPQQQHLSVEDKITLPANAPREIIFSLHAGLEPRSATSDIKITPMKETVGSLSRQFRLLLPAQRNSFTLQYEGIIYQPLGSYGKEQSRGFRQTSGIISPEGVYLAASSYWFAQFEEYPYLRFNMRVESPAGWKTVSQGSRVQHETQEGITIDHWDSQSPQEEIYLIAAQFTEYSRKADNIDAQVFLREADQKLAEKYLDATAQYVAMYEKLIGPYPYSKFALVENFWETGFGMPSFTLLGSKVIRLPFILNSSYPHEILHNWWGNGVYVDFSTGNWSEGLTAFMADHLIKEQQGKGVNYRLQSLQKYSDYAAKGRDFPLSQFRGRHSTASEAVGYGKTLMLFNMLRTQLGDKVFIKSLQQFYRQYKFKIASFDDLRETFEQVSGKPLKQFFQQWVERTGAPDLKLGQSHVTKQADVYQLRFSLKQVQSGEVYRLQIPVAVTLEGEKKSQQSFISMTQKQQTFDMKFTSRPLRIDIDPEFDLFRKLAIEETPAAFTQLFGAHDMLVILPRSVDPTLKAGWELFAEDLTRMGPDNVTIKWDNELDALPKDQAVAVLGWENRFADEVVTALSEHGVTFKTDSLKIANTQMPQADRSVALVSRFHHKKYFPRAFIATDLAAALPGLGRKLPHYHKYSYLVFSGNEPQNKLKGRWPVSRSPMTALLEGHVERGELAKRPALAEAGSVFDAQKMMQTIQFLSDESLQGRGFGQPGLDKAADYIAQAFRQAGLKPAGDDSDSFFQSWTIKGGEAQTEAHLKNIIAVIPGHHPTLKHENVVIAAHYDHLGLGWPDVRDANQGKIHAGADDNASGVAVLLELARLLGRKMKPDRNIVFVAFSGEEAGRVGSKHYTQQYKKFPADKSIGMLNLDTVGRLGDNKVLVLGGNSASEWPHIFRGISFVTGIPVALVTEDLDSSDQTSFHEAGIPAVQLFSGVNLDYHRPTDTIEKIDSAGLLKIATISKEVLEYLAAREQPLSNNLSSLKTGGRTRSDTPRKVSLGSIPDFTFEGSGYRLDGVAPNSPAETAGLIKGDIIIRINDAEIHGLRDISAVLKTLQADEIIAISYRRSGETKTTRATLKPK